MKLLCSAALALACVIPAQAALLTANGTLSASDPTYNRVHESLNLSVVGTNVYYDVFYFHTTSSSSVRIETVAASSPAVSDTFITLYGGSFNSASPQTNDIEADDEDGAGSLSKIIRSLNGGNNYVVVVTSYSNGATGNWSLQVEGNVAAGQASSGVPEPSSALLALPALAAVLWRKRK